MKKHRKSFHDSFVFVSGDVMTMIVNKIYKELNGMDPLDFPVLPFLLLCSVDITTRVHIRFTNFLCWLSKILIKFDVYLFTVKIINMLITCTSILFDRIPVSGSKITSF